MTLTWKKATGKIAQLLFNLPPWAQVFVESVDLWDRNESIIIALDAVAVLDRVLVEYVL